jgi:hypothetical protein
MITAEDNNLGHATNPDGKDSFRVPSSVLPLLTTRCLAFATVLQLLGVSAPVFSPLLPLGLVFAAIGLGACACVRSGRIENESSYTAHVVPKRDFDNFAREHPDFSYLVPKGLEAYLNENLPQSPVDLFRPAYFEVSEISAGHQRFEVRYPIHHRGCLFASQLATRSHILASLCEVSRQCGGHGLN